MSQPLTQQLPPLPAELAAGIDLVPADRPVHLLTRHSIRELAPSGFADYSLPLTAEGVALARQWGAQLERPISACFSSPVQRCIDTADAILQGAGYSADVARRHPATADGERLVAGARTDDIALVPAIEQAGVLVEPGCYVTDLRRAGRVFLQVGVRDFINQHLRLQGEGVLSPAAGRRKLLRYLFLRQPPKGQLAIHVTHDTILAAFVAGLRGCRGLAGDDWPEMLEGVWLWFGDGRVHWVWRGQPGSRSWRPLRDLMPPP